MPIDVQIRANAEQASATIKRFTSDTERETARVANRTKERFKDMAVNIAQNFSGSASVVVGGLGRIPGVAGIAVAAITGLAGAFLRLAENTAEATKETSSGSRSFLVGMENLKARMQANINLIGTSAISVFNSFFGLIGVGATKQQILNTETKRYNDLIVSTVAKTDEYVAKIKEFLIASDRLDEATITRDYFEAVAAGKTDLARAYFQQISNLKILQVETKNLQQIEVKQKTIFDDRAENLKKQGEFWATINERMAENFRLIDSLAEKIGIIDDADEDIAEFEKALERRQGEKDEAIKKSVEGYKMMASVISGPLTSALLNSVGHANRFAQNMGQAAAQIANAVIQALALRAITAGLEFLFPGSGGFFSGLFGANGIIAMQSGSIVRRPTRAIIGEAGPEAVIPLSPGKAMQRNAIMQAAGLNNGPITINISANSFDEAFVRNRLIPIINKQVRQGSKLIASKVKR